jgi:hypothetical protein
VPRWSRWSDAIRWPEIGREETSRGHLPGRTLLGDVRVDPQSRDAYLAWVRDSRMDPGAVVVELLRDPNTRAVTVAYAMEKQQDGTWEFLVVRASGEIEERGALATCRGCHSDAVADSLFGPPQTRLSPVPAASAPQSR